MSEYMITCDLPKLITEELVQLVPQQRAVVNQLFKKGALTGYTLALDRSKLWITALSNSEEGVMEILAQMPIMPFMQVEIYPLAFHNAARVILPALSLN